MNLLIRFAYYGLRTIIQQYILQPCKLKKTYPTSDISLPLSINPAFLELGEFTRIQPDVKIISAKALVTIKKFSAIGSGCLLIPGGHTPTVGIPQYLSTYHINDINSGIIINEDCWIGANSTILGGCEVGRGCVVAAGAIVTKSIPPYAVVAGAPAKIIASKFSLEQIVEHEKILYPEEERLTITFLQELFETKYKNLKHIGTSDVTTQDAEILHKARMETGIIDYSLHEH